MAKKSNKTPEASSAAPVSTSNVVHVKSIKNSLFKDLPIGESVVVGGIIRSLTDKEGSFGSYTEFKGDFGCQHNGVISRGTKLFLPSVAADTLKNQFLDALDQFEGDTTKVKIEFKISLTKAPDDSPKNAQHFQWTFENLNETAPEQDRVLALMG